MSGSDGRPALALSLPDPPPADGPGWTRGIVTGLVERNLVTAAAALVAEAGTKVVYAAAGDAAPGAEARWPLFDLASLTKPWTASLALRLDALGRLPLALELGEVWPRCDGRLARRTLEDLLRHRAGFIPWTPLYRRCRSRRTVAKLLLDGSLLGARRGSYSDLGYILWGLAASRRLGRSFAGLLRETLVEPMGLLTRPAAAAAFWLPCRLDNEREVVLAAEQGIRVATAGPPAMGRVQDGNARFLGPPAGHAGLFATPWAMLALAREWLEPATLWPASAVERALAGPGQFALGWRRATRRGSAGPALGPGSFGHVGFAGGSLWLDPTRGAAFILLAHRSRVEVDLAPARRRFHRLAIAGRDPALRGGGGRSPRSW